MTSRSSAARLDLPERVVVCPLCDGAGEYSQRYADVRMRMTGRCELCQGMQLIYRATARPCPVSVKHQVATLNSLPWDGWTLSGVPLMRLAAPPLSAAP